MKNLIKIINSSIIVAFAAVVFFTAMPSVSHAYPWNYPHDHYYGGSYNNYYPVYDPQPVNIPVRVPVTYPVYQPQTVYQPTYYTNPSPTVVYYQSNNPLSISCYANSTQVAGGQSVSWQASVSGGNGSYSYSWNGDEGLYGYGATIYKSYNNPGTKSASVTVTSGGQTQTTSCTNSVSVFNNGYYNGNNYASVYNAYTSYNSYPTNSVYTGNTTADNSTNELVVGCASDAKDVVVGTPVTWSVEVKGGTGTYTYAWSGTDSLGGSQSSVVTTYTTAGTKSAAVVVSSNDGKVASKTCTPVTVVNHTYSSRSGYSSGNNSQTPSPTPSASGAASLGAATILSLGNVPWGFVAVLIILVLFGTILYLLFNKHKV